jgi:putative transposase
LQGSQRYAGGARRGIRAGLAPDPIPGSRAAVGHRRITRPLPGFVGAVCKLLETAEEDLTAFYAFPREHWTKIRSTNPPERVNKEIGRRSDVVGIFPNDQAVIRPAGALLLEQNDECLVQRRYLSAESMALLLTEPPEPAVEAEEVAHPAA